MRISFLMKSRLRKVTWSCVSHEGSHDDICGPSVRHQVFAEHVWIGWCKCERPNEDRCNADQSTCTHCNKILQTADRVQSEGQVEDVAKWSMRSGSAEVVPRTTPQQRGSSGISEGTPLETYQCAIARWDMIVVYDDPSQTLVNKPSPCRPATSLPAVVMASSTAMPNKLQHPLCTFGLPFCSSNALSPTREA